MAIPDDDTIQRELLLLINSEPDKRIAVGDAYERLAELHPELSKQEKTEKYQNSVSKWANRVQFARLHLVQYGLLYHANEVPTAPTGYWALTKKGENKVGIIIRENLNVLLQRQVEADIASFEFENELIEGGKASRLTSFYERNSKIRFKVIKIHGVICKACGFDFLKFYGAQGENYIEVHHLTPISEYIEPTKINILTDLTVLCANCHRMIHRNKDAPLSVDELIEIIKHSSLQNADLGFEQNNPRLPSRIK